MDGPDPQALGVDDAGQARHTLAVGRGDDGVAGLAGVAACVAFLGYYLAGISASAID